MGQCKKQSAYTFGFGLLLGISIGLFLKCWTETVFMICPDPPLTLSIGSTRTASKDRSDGHFVKRARKSVHEWSGLDGAEALELEYQALSRISQFCTAEERLHFPKLLSYERGKYLKQTNQGISLFDHPIQNIGIDPLIALAQTRSILTCLQKANIFHLDFDTYPDPCKNIVLSQEPGGNMVVSLIDFDIAVVGNEPLSPELKTKLRPYAGSWDNYYHHFNKTVVDKCLLGKRQTRTNVKKYCQLKNSSSIKESEILEAAKWTCDTGMIDCSSLTYPETNTIRGRANIIFDEYYQSKNTTNPFECCFGENSDRCITELKDRKLCEIVPLKQVNDRGLCLTKRGINFETIQAAMGWVCNDGGLDCSSLNTAEPNTTAADIVFNSYYQCHSAKRENCCFDHIGNCTTDVVYLSSKHY